MKRYYTMFLSLVLTALVAAAPVAADNGGGQGGLVRLEGKVETRIDTLDTKVNARIDTLEANSNARFDALESKVDTGFESLDKRFDFIVGLGKWLIGILVTILISVLAGIVWLFDRLIKREAPPKPKAYSPSYAGGADFDALVEAVAQKLSQGNRAQATGVGEETGTEYNRDSGGNDGAPQCQQNSPPA